MCAYHASPAHNTTQHCASSWFLSVFGKSEPCMLACTGTDVQPVTVMDPVMKRPVQNPMTAFVNLTGRCGDSSAQGQITRCPSQSAGARRHRRGGRSGHMPCNSQTLPPQPRPPPRCSYPPESPLSNSQCTVAACDPCPASRLCDLCGSQP